MVVLYSSAAGTLECYFEVVVLNSKGALIGIFLLDNKTLTLEFLDKILKVLEMILPLLTPPHKAHLTLAPLILHITGNQNVLEDAFGRDGNFGYFIKRIAALHINQQIQRLYLVWL